MQDSRSCSSSSEYEFKSKAMPVTIGCSSGNWCFRLTAIGNPFSNRKQFPALTSFRALRVQNRTRAGLLTLSIIFRSVTPSHSAALRRAPVGCNDLTFVRNGRRATPRNAQRLVAHARYGAAMIVGSRW